MRQDYGANLVPVVLLLATGRGAPEGRRYGLHGPVSRNGLSFQFARVRLRVVRVDTIVHLLLKLCNSLHLVPERRMRTMLSLL